MRLYDETCVVLCEGQYIDIATASTDEPMTVELYFDMIGRKTAALIAASIEAGALLATDDEAVIAALPRASAGRSGLAFQLNDDLLGIWGEEQATGKVPTDVARHKKTLPVIYAFEHAGARGPGAARGLYADRARPRTADRRGRGHPGAGGRPGLHARGGAAPPRRVPRGAGRGWRRRAGGARAAARASSSGVISA